MKRNILLLSLFSIIFLPLISVGQTCNDAVSNDIYTSPVTRYTIQGDDAANNIGSCALDGDDAIWISITIPANAAATQMTITLDDWGGCSSFFPCVTDITGAFYSGGCGSLTTIDDCIDMTGAGSVFSNLPVTYSINPNTTYYFRLSEEDDQGGFADLLFELDSYVLPVELVDFTGKLQDENVLLNWETATEINSFEFEIEKSTDGKNFETIGIIDAAGDSERAIQYDFTDKEPLPFAYYRLKTVDLDGSFEYSKTISVMGKHSAFVLEKIYPNPASDELNIQLQLPDETEITLFVTNIMGQELIRQAIVGNSGDFTETIDISTLSDGQYLLSIFDGKTLMTERFMVGYNRP